MGQRVHQAFGKLSVVTTPAGFIDITARVEGWLAEADAERGLLTVFIRHTSASLLIQENADPDVTADLADALARLAPAHAGYRHRSEGPDDMPAHIKAAVTPVSIGIPVIDGRMVLGTWQGLYIVEHRARSHTRQIVLHFAGELSGQVSSGQA